MSRIDAESEMEFLQAYQNEFRFGNTVSEAFSNGIRVVGKKNPAYNCYAYALGARHTWLCVPNRNRLANYMTHRNFIKGTMRDLCFDPSVRKVVFYANDDDVTHAALRVRDGWHSKMGSCGILFHPTLGLISGRAYGKPFVCYVKAR